MELRLAALVVVTCAFIGFVHASPRRHSAHLSSNVGEQQLVHLLKDICSQVTDEVQDHVPAKFAELAHSLQSLPRESVSRIDRQVRDSGFCGSTKLIDIWNDALIMDTSEGSLKLIADQIIQKEVSPSRANYLFTMMAFSRKPTSGAVRAVLPILQEKDVPRQALLGISALIRNSEAGPQSSETREAVRAIAKYMERNIKHQDRVVVALKALSNIGAIDEVVDKVMDLAANPSQKSGVRVAAIDALISQAGKQQVRSKCMEIFQNTKESSEIRIAAYKILVESRERQIVEKVLQTIRREENKQVGAFVTTHLRNLQDSSSPRHEAVRQILQDEKIPVERFPQDLRKYSRNMELSQYIERLGLGGVFDADLIYDKSFTPRSLKMNLTVPLSESEVNVFEFGFRQVGLEDEIRKLVGPHLKGRNAPEILTEVFSEMVDLFDQDSASNEVPNARFARNVHKRQNNFFQKLNSKDDVEAALYLNLDGKTIAYFDIADLRNPDNDMSQAVRSLMQEIRKSDKVDRAYSFMFMKNEFEIPSKDGSAPVAVNGTIIFGLKGDKNTFVPSVALEMSTRTSGKRFQQRLSSSADLRFDVEYKNNRPVKVALRLPKDSKKLFHVQTAVFDVDTRGVETSSSASYKKMSKCTTSLTRPFGIEFCGKIVTPDEMLSNGIPPFNGLWEIELEVMKTDRQMSGWELSLELPEAGNDEWTCRVAFDTPNSRVQRRAAVLVRSFAQSQGIQLKLESPSASWDASAAYVMKSNEWSVKSDLEIDSNDKYSFEAGFRQESKNKKQEWIPVLRVSAPRMQPIALTGSLSMSQGRKAQISFELRSEVSNKQYLKGSLVKDGQISATQDYRLSSDVQADFGPINFRVFSSAEKQANSFSSDFKIDYQTPNSRKHTMKVVAKLHNLSTPSYTKVNSFVEAQTSQYPEKNFHVSWNVLLRPQEHLENELTIMWDGQMRDQNKKIHILQVSKATGLMSRRLVTAEHVVSVEIAPINFKYEFKASGSMERSQTPKFNVRVEMNNKNNKNDNVHMFADVQHVSVAPFKMTIDAAYTSAARQLKYSDKVEEVSPKVYKGRTQIQWEQEKKTTIGYTLKVKSADASKIDLDMDADIKTPLMRHGLRHSGALKLTRSSLELQSKVTYEKATVSDVSMNLRPQGKSNMQIKMKNFEGKADADLTSSSKSMSVDLKGNDFTHLSNLLIARDAATLTSKTMHKQKPVFVLNVRQNGKSATRANIECTFFDARAEVSGRDASPATAVFEYKGKTADKLALKTRATFSLSHGLELAGESKSDSSSPRSASLKIKRSNQGLSAIVHSEHNNKEWIVGKALLEQVATGVRANAQLSQWGNQIARFQSQLHRQVYTGPHDFEINFRPESSGKLQTLKIHHEIGKGEAKCLFTYLVDGEQKGQLENFARIKTSRSELDVAAGFRIKSDTRFTALRDLNWSFEHKHKNERRNFQSETRVNGQLSEEEKYELEVTSVRSADEEERKANIKLSLRTPAKYNNDVQASLDVKYATTQKFQMAIDGAITAAGREFRYSDRVEEVSPRVFKGTTQLQWQEQKTTIEYTVRVKSDRSNAEIEFDAQIKTPSMRHGLRHQGIVRIARESMDLKSEVTHEKAKIWDIDAKLRTDQKSVMRITMNGLEGNAEADFSSYPRKVTIDLKGHEFTHSSNMVISKKSIEFRSKTLSHREPKLIIDANIDEKLSTQVKIESKWFDSRFNMNAVDQSPVTAVAEFQSKTGNRLALKTKAVYTPSQGLELTGDCKSDSFDKHSAKMKIERTPRGLSAYIDSERDNKKWISGKASLEEVSTGIQADAQISKWGKEIGKFQSKLHRQVVTGPHDFEINFRPEPTDKLQTLKFHHEIGNNEVKCLFTYLVDGQQKGQLENFGRFKSSRSELDVAGGFTLKFEIRELENVHLSFQHRHKNERRSFQSESRAKAQFSEDRKYELSQTSSLTGDGIGQPLKMVIEAAAISPERELRYTDNVQEVSKGVFKGKAQFQWEQDKKTTVDYTVKAKKNRREMEVEVTSDIKSPSMRYGLRHEGRVRVSNEAFDIKTKADYEKESMWDIDAKLRKQEKSSVRITLKSLEGTAEADISSSPKSVKIDLKGNDFTHESNLLIAKDTITLSSKTMADRKAVLVINVRQNGQYATRASVDCPMFETRFEVSGRDESPAAASFDFRRKTGNKLVLKSKGTLSWADGLELTGECKTSSVAPHSASLKIKRKSQGISAAIHSERNGKEWFSGKAVLEDVESGIRVNAQLSKFGSQIGQIQSKLHRSVISGPHDIEVNIRPEPSAEQQTLKVHHEIGNGEAKCLFTYLVDGQQKGQLENFARFKSSRSEFEIAAGTILKSEIKYHGLDGVHLSFQHRHKNERRNFESDSRVKAQLSEEQKYELSLTSARSGDSEEGKASMKLNLQTPLYDFKQQSSQWSAEWSRERISMDHKTTAKNVIILFQTSIGRSDVVRGPHSLNVKYTIPQYAPWSVQARHEIVDGNLKSHAEYQVESGAMPKTLVVLRARTTDSTYMLDYQVKRNGKDSTGELVLTPRGHGVNAVMKMNQQGKEWVRLNAQVDENWISGPHDIEVVLPKTSRSQPGWYKLHHEIVNGKVNSSVVRMVNGKEQPIGDVTGRGILDTMAGIYMKA